MDSSVVFDLAREPWVESMAGTVGLEDATLFDRKD